MAFDGYGLRTPAAALTRARTVYVNSATGNDYTGDGSQARPWATLQRAWIERLQYGELRANFTIQLLGAGPYLLDFPMGASVCGAGGRLLILGDPAAYNINDSGTATGDMVNFVIPTNASIAGNNYHFLRFTSGNCAGAYFQTVETLANSIEVANNTARTALGAIANGDAWQVITPGTRISVPALPVSGTNGFQAIADWAGEVFGEGFATQPGHWFHGIAFEGAGFLRMQRAVLGFSLCRFSNAFQAAQGEIYCGLATEQTQLPGSNGQRMYGAGLVCQSSFSVLQAFMRGILSTSSSTSFGGKSNFFSYGGRMGNAGGTIGVSLGANLEGFGGPAENRILMATLSLSGASTLNVGGLGRWRSVVTTGSCLRVMTQALAMIQAAIWTGGTTDAAGYGVDVRSSGRCVFKNNTPALTGGTAGSDLRTTNVAVAANAALNANGTAVGNATDALLGEVLTRVA